MIGLLLHSVQFTDRPTRVISPAAVGRLARMRSADAAAEAVRRFVRSFEELSAIRVSICRNGLCRKNTDKERVFKADDFRLFCTMSILLATVTTRNMLTSSSGRPRLLRWD